MTVYTLTRLFAAFMLSTFANIEISRNQVHTGTSHTFCLTTTSFPCVFVKKYKVKSRKKVLL
jgi:hypothetical protein